MESRPLPAAGKSLTMCIGFDTMTECHGQSAEHMSGAWVDRRAGRGGRGAESGLNRPRSTCLCMPSAIKMY